MVYYCKTKLWKILLLMIFTTVPLIESSINTRSKKRKRNDKVQEAKTFELKVGLMGILKYRGKEIQFKLVEIRDGDEKGRPKSQKYPHFVCYPNQEYQANQIFLDLERMVYYSPALLHTGKIVNIISEGEDEDSKLTYLSRVFDVEDEDSKLTYLSRVDVMNYKIEPYEQMHGILMETGEDQKYFQFKIEKIDPHANLEQCYKYLLSFPDHEDWENKWAKFDFNENKFYIKKKLAKGDIYAINRIVLKKKTEEEIEIFKKKQRKNKLCRRGMNGFLFPNSTEKADMIFFTVILVEKKFNQKNKGDEDKLYVWVTYPNLMEKKDEYLVFDSTTSEYFDSKENQNLGSFMLAGENLMRQKQNKL